MNEEYLFYRAGRLANFLASPAPATEFFQAAPAPYFFPKRLRLLAFFSERLRLQGAKNTRLRLHGKIFFSRKLQKNIKQVIIVFLTIKLNILPKEE